MQYTFLCCQGNLKDSLESNGFCQKSGSDAYSRGWGEGEGGSCYLFHCDALYMKIDMWLTPYILTLLEPRNYDENSITIDFSIIFFQKNYLDLAVAKQKSNIKTLRKKSWENM